MNNYFKAVTLGAFTWRNERRIELFFECIQKLGVFWLVLHFFLVTFCLNFPLVFSLARLSPYEMHVRMYGDAPLAVERIEDFNSQMTDGAYGTNVLLPLLGVNFVFVMIIQIVFYLCSAVFLGLSRMNVTPLSFSRRLGLAVFSSTLPVLAAALLGFVLPTVHVIVFYFMVIFLIFQRSKLWTG